MGRDRRRLRPVPACEAIATLPLAEVLGTLSLATDLAMGQPLEHGLRACLLAAQLADRMGVDRDTAHDVYELALLRWVGCTAHAHELGGWFDDEIDARRRAAMLDFGRPADVVAELLRHAGAGRRFGERARTVAGALAGGTGPVHDLFRANGEVAERLADRLGARTGVRDALTHGWPPRHLADGAGLAARIVHVAQDAAVFHRTGGVAGAADVVRQRTGSAYDPTVARSFLADADGLLAATDQPPAWDAVMAAEPADRHVVTGDEIDAALEAVADFVDLKSPWTAGHSRAVAHLAHAAAPACGLDATRLRHAAYLHDLGRVGVPNGVWEKRGPLDTEQWELVRLHPDLTGRILARSDALRHLGEVASLHHERLDGSGYHRGADAGSQPPEARLLAVADAYQSLTADRPHRAGLEPAAAARFIQAEARAGRLDPAAVEAVVAAAGEGGGSPPRSSPDSAADLSEREVMALRQLVCSRALTEPEDGLCRKIGAGSRAAAALFAAEHGLV